MADSAAPLSFLLDKHEELYPHHLVASLPHVVNRLEEYWNNADAMADYLSDLMIPKRPNRQGFPPEVAAEIVALSLAYDKIGPVKAKKPLTESTPYGWEDQEAIEELAELGIPLTRISYARAAEMGDTTRCELFVRAGLDVDARDSREWTALMTAAYNGDKVLARKLIQLGANVHADDRGGYTPMHWAAFNGHTEIISLLLASGGVANVTSQAGITPLLQASARGHLGVVVALINGGATPNIATHDGSTPLVKAVANGHLNVINMLLAAGALTKVVMKNGMALKDIASNAKNPAIRNHAALVQA